MSTPEKACQPAGSATQAPIVFQRKLGIVAASMLIGSVGGDLVYDGMVFASSVYRGDYQDLSDQTSDVVSQTLGLDQPIKCEDTKKSVFGRIANSRSEYGIYGYVLSYRVPLTRKMIPDNTIHLDRSVCDSLAGVKNGVISTEDQIIGLFTAAHEAAHTKGIHNEAEANCLALQDTPKRFLARGYDSEDVASAKSIVHSFIRDQPAAYRSDDCVIDGAYDQTPGSSVTDDIWMPVVPLTSN